MHQRTEAGVTMPLPSDADYIAQVLTHDVDYIVQVLTRSRKRIERDAVRGITLHQISASAAYFLYDVCRCNGLDDQQTRTVMGEESWQAVENYLDLVPVKANRRK